MAKEQGGEIVLLEVAQDIKSSSTANVKEKVKLEIKSLFCAVL